MLTLLLPMTALMYKKPLLEEKSDMKLKVNAKLDPKFAPMSIVCREMREATKDDGQDIVIAVERNKGYTTTYKTRIFKDGTGRDDQNYAFVERIVKTLLWVAGGFKIIIAGSDVVANKIIIYSRGMGSLGLPGDFSSASRFIRGTFL
ncbi:MAG: linear amide C-N hydrolase, partial [Clostridia bacterium]|nr:linear amide C-N hydrolase [Clostridia bacterium]